MHFRSRFPFPFVPAFSFFQLPHLSSGITGFRKPRALSSVRSVSMVDSWSAQNRRRESLFPYIQCVGHGIKCDTSNLRPMFNMGSARGPFGGVVFTTWPNLLYYMYINTKNTACGDRNENLCAVPCLIDPYVPLELGKWEGAPDKSKKQ